MPAMNGHRILALLVATVVAPAAWTQAPDPAEERARLANQRIQAEAARQAEEERARREMTPQAAAAQPVAPGPAQSPAVVAVPPPSTPATSVPTPSISQAPAGTEAARQARDAQTSRALEQLKQLGELRDAGYVTEQEFERIKSRILDDRF
jgi:hypothetical protein